jgi:hypothetical protein
VLRRQPPGTERLDLRLGGRDVVDHHVQVHLLRPLRVTPLRGPVVGRELEREPRRVRPLRDDHPVVASVGHVQSQQLGVERGQGRRVGTVQYDVVSASDHGTSMPVPPVVRLILLAVPLRR